MDRLVIQGGIPLRGRVSVSGAKNAALPIMAATIAVDGPCRLRNIPDLADVRILSDVLTRLGMEVARLPDGDLAVETRSVSTVTADYELVRRMRASICVLGPLLASRGQARVALPGGCQIGLRPIDLHLRGLAALGAEIRIEHGDIVASAHSLRGADIDLAGPHGSTVTGTCNVMTAAVFAEGTTRIRHAALEPEVVDLAHFLIAMGAEIEGAGSPTIRIEGGRRLAGREPYSIIPDRIEAATLLMAAAITGGDVVVENVRTDHLGAVFDVLRAIGVAWEAAGPNGIRVRGAREFRGIDCVAEPYPGIPTDVQAQVTALLCLAAGESTLRDDVFPDRFLHVPELQRLGADLQRDGSRTVIRGVQRLSGAAVRASDLRASAALILAGLAADGETTIYDIGHLDRGYERLAEKLTGLGASVARVGTGMAGD